MGPIFGRRMKGVFHANAGIARIQGRAARRRRCTVASTTGSVVVVVVVTIGSAVRLDGGRFSILDGFQLRGRHCRYRAIVRRFRHVTLHQLQMFLLFLFIILLLLVAARHLLL